MQKTPFQRAIPYFWSRHRLLFKCLILLSFALLVGAKILAAYVPIYFQKTIDVLNGPEQGIAAVVALIVMYGLVRLLSTSLSDIREILFARVLYRAIRFLALDVFEHLHSLSLRFHLDRKTGAVTRYIEQGVMAMERLIQFAMMGALPTFFEMLFIGVFIFALFPVHFFSIIFVTLFLYVFSTYMITEYRTRVLRRRNDLEAHSNYRAVDSLLNYETVKYFGNESSESQSYDATLSNYEKISIKLRESLALLNVVQGVIASVGLAVCMYYAALGVSDNTLSLGQYVMIHAYLMQLYIPLGNLGFMYREMKEAHLKLNMMTEVLEAEVDIQDIENPKTLSVEGLRIRFDHVGFAYIPNRPILKGVSFELEEGKTIAIVGESGSGKSTITRLLFRFYDVDSGGIHINGQDIRNLAQKDVRSLMAVVPQDTVLFNDTLEYNLRYGRMTATDEELQAAIEGAHLQAFIQQLPDGLNTMVGERGLKLSGGEKQRVAIARALLKNPKLFIFDEATSALDTQTEQEIQHNLMEISRGRTTLVIAHRLSTIVSADEILVLDKGRIVERGTHQSLLAENGVYSRMWAQQVQDA